MGLLRYTRGSLKLNFNCCKPSSHLKIAIVIITKINFYITYNTKLKSIAIIYFWNIEHAKYGYVNMFTLYVYCANWAGTEAFVRKIETNAPQPLVYLKMFFLPFIWWREAISYIRLFIACSMIAIFQKLRKSCAVIFFTNQ